MNLQADRVAQTLQGLAQQVGEVPRWEVMGYLRLLAAQALKRPDNREEALRNVWTVLEPDGISWFSEKF